MRLRIAVPASLLAAFALAVAPGLASAAPHHNHGLTIAATPDPIVAGDAVLIYGRLLDAPVANKTIVLYHRVNPADQFTVIGQTKTDNTGYYSFKRETGVVESNRSWFVLEAGTQGKVHSRTVHEHVMAAISLTASTTTVDTLHPVVFSGHVDPNHAGERVYLQVQDGLSGDDWTTLKSGELGPGSNYSIAYRFKVPAERDVRVALARDDRNIASVSDTLSVIVQQTQKPGFTINTSAPIIPADGSTPAKISGVLSLPATTTPDPKVSVTLWARQDPFTEAHQFEPVGAPVMTGTDGSYSFTVTPTHNTEYQVRTTFVPPLRRASAVLFEGARDVVSINPIPATSTVGQTVTFAGGVTPDKTGHVIELQRKGKDGDFHTVAIGRVNASSAYKFVWEFGSDGTKVFRVHIPGGPENVGGNSDQVSINVLLPAVQKLPAAA